MKYAIAFVILAFALAGLAYFLGSVVGLLLLWLAGNFFVIGWAYTSERHRIYGKRIDGRLPIWSWVLFLPMHLLNFAVWHGYRLCNSRPAWNRVTDDLVIGRRLLPREYERLCREMNSGGFANYVDLTAEFAEPQMVRRATCYLAFPILDGSAPESETLREVIARLPRGPTFVHCAQGYGRTGLFTLAILLSSGKVHTVEEGLALLNSARPGVHLNGEQIRCAQDVAVR